MFVYVDLSKSLKLIIKYSTLIKSGVGFNYVLVHLFASLVGFSNYNAILRGQSFVTTIRGSRQLLHARFKKLDRRTVAN